MGKKYDFTLTAGLDDSFVNQIIAKMGKSIENLTKKDNVVTITADTSDFTKALQEIVKLNPQIGATIDVQINQAEINKELDFLNGIINSKTKLDGKQIASKLKNEFTSGLKDLNLGDVLLSEVNDSSRSVKNIQKAVDSIVGKLESVDLVETTDFSEMVNYVQNLEKAQIIIDQVSKNSKLSKVDLSKIDSLVTPDEIKNSYLDISEAIINQHESLLAGLKQKSIDEFKELQNQIQGILNSGIGAVGKTNTSNLTAEESELALNKELEVANKKMENLEKKFQVTQKSAEQLENEMLQIAAHINKFDEEDNEKGVKSLQKTLIAYGEIYKKVSGIDLFDEGILEDKSLEKLETVIQLLADAKDELPNYKFEVVTKEDIEKQRALISELENNIKEVKQGAEKADLSTPQFVTEEEVSNSKELTQQLEKAEDALAEERQYSSNLGDELFEANQQVKELTEKLQKAEAQLKETSLNIVPKVDPNEFAQEINKQLTVPAQIEVEGKISDPSKFAWDIAGMSQDIPLPVTFQDVSDEEYEELKKTLNFYAESLALEIPIRFNGSELNSSLPIEEATKAIKDEGEAAKKAAKYKEEFAKANEKIAEAAQKTAKATRASSNTTSKESNDEKVRERVLQTEQKVDRKLQADLEKQSNQELKTSYDKQEQTINKIYSLKKSNLELSIKETEEAKTKIKQNEEEVSILEKEYALLRNNLPTLDISDYQNERETALGNLIDSKIKELNNTEDSIIARLADASNKESAKKKSNDSSKAEKAIQAEIASIYSQQEENIKEIYSLRKKNLSYNANDIEDAKKLATNQERINKLESDNLALKTRLNDLPPDIERQKKLTQILIEQKDAYVDLISVQNVANRKASATEVNEKAATAYKEITKQANRYYTLLNKEAANTLTGNERLELDNLEKEWSYAVNAVGKYKTAIDGTKKSLDAALAAQDKFFNVGSSSIVESMNKRFQGYQDKINPIVQNPEGFFINGEQLTKESSALVTVEEIINRLNNTPIDIKTKDSRDEIAELEKEVKDFFDSIEKGAKEVSVEGVRNQISEYLTKNTALSLKFRVQLHALSEELKKGVSAERFKEIYSDLLRIQQEARSLGQEGKSTLDTLSSRLSDMDSKFLAQLLSWQDIIRYIREVASAVIELDTALTEMRKVSDESLASLQKYQDISFGIADEIGVTGAQLQNSTADFMRLGESLEDAAESARVANVLMNVSEFESIDEATDSLIAMASAYSDLEKMDIVDKLNTIGNNYSISTDGLATALQDSASALVTAYNSIDEAVALITAGNAVTQDPAKVGAGLRTISLRLTGTKEAAETLQELGEETDGMIMTESKLRQTIMDATKAASKDGKGFDILDNNGNYKSTYEIMLGLAELYDDIIRKDKELGTNNLNLLLETIAGKNRSNIAASILQNPDLLKDAFEDSAINSTNSALKENEKYLESIQGHIQKFQNAVQELFHYLLESGTINKVIDLGTKFVNFLTDVVKTLGSTGSLVTAGSFILLLRNSGKIITGLTKKLPELVEAFSLLKGGAGSFTEVLQLLFPTITKIIGTLAPFAPYIIGIGAALGIASAAWDYFTITTEEAEEALTDFRAEADTLKSNLKSHEELVENVADRYEELAGGVDTLTNKNLTLSNDDYQEYLDITTQLGEAFPELIKSSDEYGGYILTIGDNYKYAAEELRNYLDEEEKRYYYSQYKNLGDISENSQVLLDSYKEDIERAEYEKDLVDDRIKAVALLKETIEEYKNATESINLNEIFSNAGISNTARNDVLSAFRDYGLDDIISLRDEGTLNNWTLDLSEVNEENQQAIDDYFNSIVVEYESDLSGAIQELNNANAQYESEWMLLRQAISDALMFQLSGDDISDSTRQLAQQYASSLTSEVVDSFADESGKVDYQKLVNNFASEFKNLDLNEQIEFTKLFNPELSPEEKIAVYNNLQSIFDEKGIKIPLEFIIEDEEDVVNRVKEAYGKLTGTGSGKSFVSIAAQTLQRSVAQARGEEVLPTYEELFDEIGADTVEEYNKILQIINGCKTWEEAVQKVRDAYASASQELDSFDYSPLDDAISDVNEKLLPQFQELGTLYDEIFNGDNGFDLSGIGASDLQGVIDTFKNLDEALEIDPPTEAIDEFIRVISNSSSTAGQVQESFDALATAYFNAAVEAGNFSAENATVLEQMLTEMGIANASEVVDYYEQVAVAKKLAADNGKDLANMTAAEIEQFAQEVGASEETANALYILALKKIFLNENWVNEETSVEQVLALAKAAGIATEAVTKLANVQAQISGIKANIANELKSGNPNTTNISDWEAQLAGLEQSAADYANQIEEDINNVTVDIEFSVPKTSSGGGSAAREAGKEDGEDYVDAFEEALKELEEKRDAGLLTEKEFLAEYKALIEKFFGTGLESPIAEEDLQAAQEYADSLDDIYKSYNGINNMDRDFIAWDEDTVKKYSDFVIEQFGSIEEGMKELEGTWSTVMGGVENIDDVKIAFSNLLQTDHGLVPLTSDVLWDYIEDIYKKAIDENGVFDVEKFIQLDKEGSDREIYGQMEHVANMIAAAEGQMLNGIKITADDVIAIGTPGEDLPEELESIFKGFSMHDIQANTLLKSYSDFLGQMEGKTEEFVKHMHDYFERLTTYYESVFSAIGTILTHRINALEQSKSDAVKAINEEKEAAAASYQAQIDYIDGLIDAKEAEIDAIDDEIEKYEDQISAIDKQIEALEDANEHRQKALDLQKAQMALEQAQNQRTKMVYKDGQLVYENDTSAVRDARENLEDAEFEIQKQKLEDLKKPLEEQIELLEKRKELIQDEIDGYEKQQEALQKALERSNEYYDKLIKDTEAYWDGLIEKLEKTKSKYEELAELKELSNAFSLIQEYIQDTGYTIEDVLNDTPGVFEKFLSDYEEALIGANANNENFAQSLALAEQEVASSFGKISSDAGTTATALSPLAEALKPIADSATDISDTATALGDVATNSDKVATSTGTASTNTESLSESLGTIASDAPSAAQGMEATAESIEHEGSAAATAAPQKERLATANEKLGQLSATVADNVEAAAEAISDEGTNAESAYTSLNNIANLNLATIVTQTKLLAEALSEVASALGLSEDATVSALETTITKLSQMSLGDEQTGIVGSFNALKAAVTGVTDAIGGGSGGGTSGGDGTTDKSQSMSEGAEDGGSSGLIQAIADLHEAADTHIGTGSGEEGEEGGTVISDFDALKAAIDLVAETIGIASENGEVSETSLIGVIQTLPELTEEPMTTVIGFFTSLQEAIAACSAAVDDLAGKIKSLGGAGGGSLSLSLSGGEATGNVHIGNAYAGGKLGIKKSENALVGEVGRELVYNPATGTYRTVGDHGPEITRLNKGDLVFNAKQTEAIIKNGKRDHGHSYADGNAGFMPLTDEEMNLFTKIGSAVADMQMDIRQMLDPVRSMAQNVTRNTTNIAPVININDTKFEVSGVTGEEVTRQISDTFSGIISNAYQRAMKR